jgi:hypothetical protein
MSSDDIVATTIKITSILEDLNIPYILGDSLASTFYGTICATFDADLVVALQSNQVNEFLERIPANFLVDRNIVQDAIDHYSSFNLIDQSTLMKVDLFVVPLEGFDKSQLERRVRGVIREPDIKVWFTSAEDIILKKLEWYKIGNLVSERQWRDILGVMKFQSQSLDWEYLEKWASVLGVDNLLAEARMNSET